MAPPSRIEYLAWRSPKLARSGREVQGREVERIGREVERSGREVQRSDREVERSGRDRFLTRCVLRRCRVSVSVPTTLAQAMVHKPHK